MHRYGGAAELALEEHEPPQPAAGEARVEVRAIGLDFADLMARQGVYPRTPRPPFTPGMEVAGVVDRVGEGVDGDLIGRRVMAVPIFGGHSEQVCVPMEHLIAMPAEVTFEDAAAFPVCYLTAHHALHELGRARRGERALVTAAAGGVGTAVLQLAAPAGVRMMAVVGAEAKREVALRLGAELACGYDGCGAEVRRHFGTLDLVLDSVAGAVFRPLWNLLAPGGRYVLYGFASAATSGGISYLRAARGLMAMGALLPHRMVGANRTLAGFNLSLAPNLVETMRANADLLVARWRDGQLQPIIGRVFPFTELPEAHRHLQSRASTGKVVVTVP